jgi:hypothetical protein
LCSIILHWPGSPGVVLGHRNRITMCHTIISAASLRSCLSFVSSPSLPHCFLLHIPISLYILFVHVGVPVTFLEAY